MADHLVSLEEIRAARGLVAGALHRTPILTSATAARMVRATCGVDVANGRIHLKAEHLQRTGSFKPRGALARLAALTADERARGVITLSAGNAAQAYAWAGAQAGVRVTVVMPAGAVRSKVDACLAYGAEVVLHGAHVGETFERMETLRDERVERNRPRGLRDRCVGPPPVEVAVAEHLVPGVRNRDSRTGDGG